MTVQTHVNRTRKFEELSLDVASDFESAFEKAIHF